MHCVTLVALALAVLLLAGGAEASLTIRSKHYHRRHQRHNHHQHKKHHDEPEGDDDGDDEADDADDDDDEAEEADDADDGDEADDDDDGDEADEADDDDAEAEEAEPPTTEENFDAMDDSGDNQISKNEAYDYASEKEGADIDSKEMDEMMDTADEDQDGYLNEEEFAGAGEKIEGDGDETEGVTDELTSAEPEPDDFQEEVVDQMDPEFVMVDKNEDGCLDKAEVTAFLKADFPEGTPDAVAEPLAQSMFNFCDRQTQDTPDCCSPEEFKKVKEMEEGPPDEPQGEADTGTGFMHLHRKVQTVHGPTHARRGRADAKRLWQWFHRYHTH